MYSFAFSTCSSVTISISVFAKLVSAFFWHDVSKIIEVINTVIFSSFHAVIFLYISETFVGNLST